MAEVEKPKPALKIISMTQRVQARHLPSYEAVGWQVAPENPREKVEGEVLIERDFRSE